MNTITVITRNYIAYLLVLTKIYFIQYPSKVLAKMLPILS